MPALSSHTAPGAFISADVPTPPLPENPGAPFGSPATVYTKFWVMVWPNSLCPVPATSWIRLLAVSAMYMFPLGTRTDSGKFRLDEVWDLLSLPMVQLALPPRPATV